MMISFSPTRENIIPVHGEYILSLFFKIYGSYKDHY